MASPWTIRVIAGVILTLMPVFFTLLTRAVCPTTKDELVKGLSTSASPDTTICTRSRSCS